MTTNMTVKPIPEDYHSVTPYLTVRGAAEVIDFLKQTFKAEVVKEPLKRPDGKIMHAEVKIGDSRVMISDENEMMKATPSSLYIYVPNVDSVFQQAVKAGGKTVMEPMDMFYGDRSGSVKILPAIVGPSRRTRKTCRRRKWQNALKPSSRNSSRNRSTGQLEPDRLFLSSLLPMRRGEEGCSPWMTPWSSSIWCWA